MSSISRRPITSARRWSASAAVTAGSSSGGSSRTTLAARRWRKSSSIAVRTSSGVRPESRGAMSAGCMRASSRSARPAAPLASSRRRMRALTSGFAMRRGSNPESLKPLLGTPQICGLACSAQEPPVSSRHLVLVPHKHWDREWYLTHETFRFRLVHLLDGVLDLLERDPAFRCFTLDGQTIVLADYLEVRPGARERIAKLVRDGRLWIGPWFVLPDEWLVSGEA